MSWETFELGDLAESVAYGLSESASETEHGQKFLRITDIQGGVVDWDSVPWCNAKGPAAIEARLRPGDIVFARTGATTGKSYLIRDCPKHAVFASYLIRVRFDHSVVPGFIYHYFQTPDYWAQISKGARGVAQPGVNASTLKGLRIPLPPLPEQLRLTSVLDQADALRAQRRAAIADVDTLTQAIFLDLFGDPASVSWPFVSLHEVVNVESGGIRTGPFGSQLLHSEFVAAGIAVLGIDNVVGNSFRWDQRRYITEAKFQELKRFTVFPGDVLISIMGTCGRCAIVPEGIGRAINTKHLCCISLKRDICLPEFLRAYFLLHPLALRHLGQAAKGAVMPGLNMGIIKSMPLLLPPLSLQQEFARRVAAVEKLKAAHQASLAELDALFASLQHRAFRGEL